MRREPWNLAGIIVLIMGMLLALVVYLILPTTSVQFGFQLDASILVLAPAILIAVVLFGIGAVYRSAREQTRRALKAQAAALEDQRRQFIRRLDHELKNPITAIQIQLDNLQSIQGQDDAAVKALRVQVDRLAQLTRGLRRLSDLEIRPLELERVEVEELMGEVVELVGVPERIELDIQQRPWEPPPIRGDRELLLLAFRNLVENALNYSDGMVEVRARQASDQLQIEVIDTGRGIPESDLPHVTDELYRASNVHEIPGSGLGLALADRIIERHGGTLELRSRSGQGTIATVLLEHEAE